jgi:hypothetical protein
MPQRIQRKRTKDWRMPENCLYVGRPTKWGNPFKIGMIIREPETNEFITELKTIDDVLVWYKNYLRYTGKIEDVEELKGKDLCCWCKIGDKCHADILLEIANS